MQSPRGQWAGIPWVRFAFVVLLTSSSNVAHILIPPYLRDQQYDYTVIGLLVALTGIASLGSRFPAGAIYRLSRARTISALAVASLGTGFLLYPLVAEPLMFSIVQLVVGLSMGVATSTNLAMYIDSLPRTADRHRAMAFYAGALAAGHTVGNLVGGIAGDVLGYAPAFQIGSAMMFASLIFLFLDRPGQLVSVESAPAKTPSVRLPLRERLAVSLRAMAEPHVVALSLVAFLLNFLQGLISTFFPLYALSIGLSLSEIGLLRSVHSLVNAVARPLASGPIRKLGAARASFLGLGVLAGLDALLPTQSLTLLFAALLASIGLIRAIVLVANTVELADVDERRMSRGLATSLFSSSQDLGSLSSPALCGALASLIGLTTMMAVVPLASAGLFFVLLAMLSRAGPTASNA